MDSKTDAAEEKIIRRMRSLAKKILDRDFPDRRKPTCVVPEMQWRGLMQYCDRDAFDALVKAETPRHAPSVSPKKNNGQTL